MSKTPSDKFNDFVNDLLHHTQKLNEDVVAPFIQSMLSSEEVSNMKTVCKSVKDQLSNTEKLKDELLKKQEELVEYFEEKLDYIHDHRFDKVAAMMEEYGENFYNITMTKINELKEQLKKHTTEKENTEKSPPQNSYRQTSNIYTIPGLPNIPLRDQIYKLMKASNCDLTRDILQLTKLYNDVKSHTNWRGKSSYPGDDETTIKDFIECLYPYNLCCVPPNLHIVLATLDKNTNLFSFMNEINYLVQHPEYVPQPLQKQILGRLYKNLDNSIVTHKKQILATLDKIYVLRYLNTVQYYIEKRGADTTLLEILQEYEQTSELLGIQNLFFREDKLIDIYNTLQNRVAEIKSKEETGTCGNGNCKCKKIKELIDSEFVQKLADVLVQENITIPELRIFMDKINTYYKLNPIYDTKNFIDYLISETNEYWQSYKKIIDTCKDVYLYKINHTLDFMEKHPDLYPEVYNLSHPQVQQSSVDSKSSVNNVNALYEKIDDRIIKEGLPKTENTFIEQAMKEFEQDLKVDNSQSPLLQYIKIPKTLKEHDNSPNPHNKIVTEEEIRNNPLFKAVCKLLSKAVKPIDEFIKTTEDYAANTDDKMLKQDSTTSPLIQFLQPQLNEAIEKVTGLPITQQYDLYKTCGEMDGYLLQWTYTKPSSDGHSLVRLRVIMRDYPKVTNIPEHLTNMISFCAALIPHKATNSYEHEYEPQVYALNKQNNFRTTFRFDNFEHYTSNINFAYLK